MGLDESTTQPGENLDITHQNNVKTKRFELFNKTPRRIAIPSIKPDQNDYLVISPFSTKVLTEDAIRGYNYEPWVQEDLINKKEVVEKSDESSTALDFGLGCGVWLLLYLVVALVIPLFRTSAITWIVFATLLVAILIAASATAGSFKNIKKDAKRLFQGALQAINLVVFLGVVFGLGVGLFYLFSGGKQLATTHEFTLENLGRVIQYLFLTIATLLPALMYYLFNRLQREKIQENFIREVLRLDPGIRTITEAEYKYLPLVQENFGTTHVSAFLFSSGLPILLSTLLILVGWLIVLQPFAVSTPIDAQKLENLLLPRANAITFAFLGAYFFAINLVFRRYVRADLTPKTYTYIILRLLMAIILIWTLSALPLFASGANGTQASGSESTPGEVFTGVAANNGTGSGGFSTDLLYLLAFFIGVFPETGMTVLRDLARNPFFTRIFPRLEEEHPLTNLDGINLYDRSRFIEEGIENIENLAHHNLISLMLSTRISTNRLVDLFDQAILYLHLGLDPNKIADAREKLRNYGIRTATDLEVAYEIAEARGQAELEKFLTILDDKSDSPASLPRLQTILDTLKDDDWMNYLRNWRELSQRSTQTFTLKGVTLVPLEENVQQAMLKAI